ncbi:MAG: DUF1684 domain-containing protein [Chloroflexota bacterium]
MAPSHPFTLTDWRRTIFALYADIRNCPYDHRRASWDKFRNIRDQLFAQHPQTPLNAEQKRQFTGLNYFDYDDDYVVLGKVDFGIERETLTTELDVDGQFDYTRIGLIDFQLKRRRHQLNLYWINGYGGALYLPFGDLTNANHTYGGGRYLYDAIKGADLGTVGEEIVLDFNFAYNPSCAYNDLWSCPLPPAENKLNVEILAGEKALG